MQKKNNPNSCSDRILFRIVGKSIKDRFNCK